MAIVRWNWAATAVGCWAICAGRSFTRDGFIASRERNSGKQFLADPDRFVPVNSGNDVVLSVDENRSVPGQPAYCATYNDRLYMFSSAATQAEFNRQPGTVRVTRHE